MDKPVISTISSAILGLIVVYPSGVVYSHQAGGYACTHPELEGVLIPLDDWRNYKGGSIYGSELLMDKLNKHFTGPAYGGWCATGITKKTARFINNLLPLYIRVDDEKRHESQEAWVWVKINSSDTATWHGFSDNISAVLIWENSD